MPEEEIKKEEEVEEEVKEEPKKETPILPLGEFTPIQHLHRGTDTPRISYNDLKDKPTTGFQLIKSGTFTNDILIEDLDGDNDGIYELLIRTNHSSGHNILLRFNEDSEANYNNIRHYISKQGASSYHDKEVLTEETSANPTFITQKNFILQCIINPKSGYQRIVHSSCAGSEGAANYSDLAETASFWTNTADNLISIKIITGAITSGEYFLFKTK